MSRTSVCPFVRLSRGPVEGRLHIMSALGGRPLVYVNGRRCSHRRSTFADAMTINGFDHNIILY